MMKQNLKSLWIILLPLLLCCGCASGLKHSKISTVKKTHLYFTDIADAALEQQLIKRDTPGDRFLLATVYDDTGRPELALERYIETVEAARKSEALHWEGLAAAIALVEIRNRVRDFEERLTPWLITWSNQPGELAPEAVFQLKTLYFSFLQNTGNSSESNAVLASTGCITSWTIAGTFGADKKGQQSVKALNRLNVWPRTLDGGGGRPSLPVQDKEYSVCHITADPPMNQFSGTVVAKTTIRADQSGTFHFRLHGTADMRVWVNGHEVWAQRSEARWLPENRWFSVPLIQGGHEIRIEAYSPEYTPAFSLSVLTDRMEPVASGTDWRLSAHHAAPGAVHAMSVPAPQTESATLAKMHYDIWNVDPVSWLNPRVPRKQVIARLQLRRAEYEQMTPFNAFETGMENARSLYRDALQKNAHFVRAAMFLAEHEQRNGRIAEAIAMLESAIAVVPTEPLLHLTLLDFYYDNQWKQSAHHTLDELKKLVGTNCAVHNWEYALAVDDENYELAERASRKISQCAAASSVFATELARNGKFSEAATRIRQIAALQPDNLDLQLNVATTLSNAGHLRKSIAKLEETASKFPLDIQTRVLLLDAYLAAGEVKKAGKICEKGTLWPMNPDFFHICEIVTGKSAIQTYRIDGLQTVRAHLAEKTEVSTDFAWILDRMVYLVDDFGSGMQLTHWIGKVNSVDAVDAHGELDVPPGAEVLTARVIKPNLEVLYPTSVEYKSSISLPNLAVGDFIEFESLTHTPPHSIFPGGFDTEPFFFRDFQSTFVRSELIVIAPASVRMQYDLRGDAPQPEENHFDGIRTATFRARNIPPLSSEPSAPDPVEYLPSVRVTANASMDEYCHWLNRQLYGKSQPDPEIVRFIHAYILRDVGPDQDAKAAAIYNWIMANVADDMQWFEPASHIFSRRRGNRARLFVYMARLAGLKAELGIASTPWDDSTYTDIAQLNRYTVPVVKLPDNRWISLDQKYGPIGLIPTHLRNQPTLLPQSCTVEKMDMGQIPEDETTVDASLEVSSDGNATGTVTLSLIGDEAAYLRGELQKPTSQRRKLIETHLLSGHFPEAVLNTYTIHNESELQKPLIVECNIDVPDIIQNTDEGQHLNLPLTVDFTQFSSGESSRTLPLVLAAYQKARRFVHISLPPSMKVKKTPPNACIRIPAPQAGYCQKFSQGNQQLSVEMTADIHIDRVSPEHYSDYQQFLRTTEHMNSGQIDIR